MGSVTGILLDAQTNNTIPFASIQLYKSDLNKLASILTTGQLTDENGKFSIQNIDTAFSYFLKIEVLGYAQKEISISFKNKITAINLNQIKIETNVKQLKTVEISGDDPSLQLELDKKVYNVGQNPASTGGTAEDVLKNVPGVSVDMDGNVTVNNASPQILIDGRPTTLTLDQIASETIENIEVISNPSAKYDASGGTGGIINIRLKKSKRIGYSGNVRTNVDMFGRITSGFDFNLRQNKINFFTSADYNQRMSKSYGVNERDYLASYAPVSLTQNFDALFYGLTISAKAGLDYYINKKNTLTVSYSYNQARFEPFENFYVQTDSITDSTTTSSSYYRQSDIIRHSYTSNIALTFKHSFEKKGHELSADANYQANEFNNANQYHTQNFNDDSIKMGDLILQQQYGNSQTQLITLQSDYVNPLTEKTKLEAGVRSYMKNFSSNTNDYLYDYGNGTYEMEPELTNNYKYNENIYAAYAMLSGEIKKTKVQAGLRVESSYYKGEIIDSVLSFTNQYPLSWFPSIFLSRKKGEKHNFQLGYSRRINRPTFTQLTPYVDYTDSLNVKRGNPSLKPEFANTAEFDYQYTIDKENAILSTLYLKNTTDIITSFQLTEYNNYFQKDIIINTYENANSSYVYGLELISKNKIKEAIDVIATVNIFNAIVKGSEFQNNLENQLLSWSTKLNMNIKLPYNFSYQIIGNYQSKMITPVSSGNGNKDGNNSTTGGNSWWNAQTSMIQGYTLPRYDVDMSIKFEFLKNKVATIVFSVSDVFKTKRQANYYQTDYYTQSVYRIRNPQYYKLSFSYRFGKQDPDLLKRKSSKQDLSDSEMQ